MSLAIWYMQNTKVSFPLCVCPLQALNFLPYTNSWIYLEVGGTSNNRIRTSEAQPLPATKETTEGILSNCAPHPRPCCTCQAPPCLHTCRPRRIRFSHFLCFSGWQLAHLSGNGGLPERWRAQRERDAICADLRGTYKGVLEAFLGLTL